MRVLTRVLTRVQDKPQLQRGVLHVLSLFLDTRPEDADRECGPLFELVVSRVIAHEDKQVSSS